MNANRGKSKIPGVRYREHKARKRGLQKDRYYIIYYTANGKQFEESIGWASEGWTEQKAADILFELKKNHTLGSGPQTLAEKRELAIKEQQAIKSEESKSITFSELYEKYIENQKLKAKESTWKTENGLYRCWVKKSLKNMVLEEITIDYLQNIISNAQKANKSAATLRYIKCFLRQVFNYAISRELYSGNNPACKIFTPKVDNRRQRFFTRDELNKILEALKERSQQTHDIALLAMYTGFRPGEIFSLCWENVDFENEMITAFDTKGKITKHVPMTKNIAELLASLKIENSTGLVFRCKNGEKIKDVSNTFSKVVDELGINDGVTDRRKKCVFYTLRHSYASWLVMEGTDLYTVKELMGHSTTAMTERYSHLSPEHLKKAVKVLDKYSVSSSVSLLN